LYNWHRSGIHEGRALCSALIGRNIDVDAAEAMLSNIGALAGVFGPISRSTHPLTRHPTNAVSQQACTRMSRCQPRAVSASEPGYLKANMVLILMAFGPAQGSGLEANTNVVQVEATQATFHRA